MSRYQTLSERFWAKVNRDGDCWMWTGTLNHKGYGQFWFGTKHHQSHRASWMMHRGPIPDGMWVLHKCDTPSCVNPAHLYLGTHAENMADMVARGRGTTKTVCRHGHLYTPENTYRDSRDGSKKCRACAVRNARESRRRRGAA